MAGRWALLPCSPMPATTSATSPDWCWPGVERWRLVQDRAPATPMAGNAPTFSQHSPTHCCCLWRRGTGEGGVRQAEGDSSGAGRNHHGVAAVGIVVNAGTAILFIS